MAKKVKEKDILELYYLKHNVKKTGMKVLHIIMRKMRKEE